MKILHLSLIGKYFHMSNPKTNFDNLKTEDYRQLTPYWASRLLLFDGKKEKECFWSMMPIMFDKGTFLHYKNITPIPFTHNKMTLGYPNKYDLSKQLLFEHVGIEVREGRTEWGAEKGKLYFVVKHGKLVS